MSYPTPHVCFLVYIPYPAAALLRTGAPLSCACFAALVCQREAVSCPALTLNRAAATSYPSAVWLAREAMEKPLVTCLLSTADMLCLYCDL